MMRLTRTMPHSAVGPAPQAA